MLWAYIRPKKNILEERSFFENVGPWDMCQKLDKSRRSTPTRHLVAIRDTIFFLFLYGGGDEVKHGVPTAGAAASDPPLAGEV